MTVRNGFLLIIEDEPMIADILAILTEQAGYHPLTVDTAEKAQALMEQAKPVAVITDVRLPGMDGVQFIEQLRAGDTAKVPVLMISAFGEPSNHKADDFLAKPFDTDELIARIHSIIQNDGNGRRASIREQLPDSFREQAGCGAAH